MEKINSITRSISKFISLIYFSIKITIKEQLAKNGGHLSSGNTIAVNNLVYFRGILVGPMIVIVSWAIENNLVYFAQKRRLICGCDSFLGY